MVNSSFYNNYVQTDSTDKTSAQGGAIYNERGTLNIAATNGKQSVFSGNKIIYKDENGNDVEESNAIHMSDGVLNLSATNDGQIIFNDKISTSEDNVVEFNIGGDNTGLVIFANDINHAGNISVSNTNVDVRAQGFDRANIQDGAIVNVSTGAIVNDSIVNSGALLTIKAGGNAVETTVADGGKLLVQSSGLANNTTVFSGGTLEAQTYARLNNLLADDGSNLNIDKGSTLSGNIVINAGANLSGTYDYSKIFKDSVSDSGSLTFVGGFNDIITTDSLVNTADNKKLILSDGDYTIGSGAQDVSGWDSLTLSDNANVKLEGEIAMSSPASVINITNGSVLDLAGHSPLTTIINGSINNDGTITFSHADDFADDVITVYGNYTAYTNAKMSVDFDPTTKKADIMLVDGDVAGTTKVTLYKVTDGTTTDLIKFVEAPNDDNSTGAYFTIDRVYRVAQDISDQWKIVYKDKSWFVTSSDNQTEETNGYGTSDVGDLKVEETPDVILPNDFPSRPSKPVYPDPTRTKLYSEALGYISLPSIGLEQTRDLVRIVSNKVVPTNTARRHCNGKRCHYHVKPINDAWIDINHRKSNIDVPVEVDAEIQSVDFGFDIQQNLHNRLGLFASYRQGKYDLSGDGEKYYSNYGSDIDIDSWMVGLYHRYDSYRVWALSTIYGGTHKVDLTTDDDVTADTDGIQFGGSVEAGITFRPQKRLAIEPSVRLGYNFIKYDDMSDDSGKTAEFDNIHNVEAEVGVKVEKTFFRSRYVQAGKLYIKPSIIQNFGKGDVNITSLDSVEGVENQTLIRGELGGSFNLGNGWSGFGGVGYTFGSDYNASDFNLGLNYNW